MTKMDKNAWLVHEMAHMGLSQLGYSAIVEMVAGEEIYYFMDHSQQSVIFIHHDFTYDKWAGPDEEKLTEMERVVIEKAISNWHKFARLTFEHKSGESVWVQGVLTSMGLIVPQLKASSMADQKVKTYSDRYK